MRLLLALVLLPAATASCPDDTWRQVANKCFKFVESRSTFTQCQYDVCAPLGANLATIGSEQDQAAVDDISDGHYAYFGLFEGGADESGEWQFVDGSKAYQDSQYVHYTNWEEGEPNQYCDVEEDCAMVGPAWDGWVDVSCGIEVNCLCSTLNGQAEALSQEFLDHETDIMKADASDYDACEDDEARKCDDVLDELDELRESQNGLVTAIVVLVFVVLALGITVLALLCVKTQGLGSALGTSQFGASSVSRPVRGTIAMNPVVHGGDGYAPPPES